MKRLLKYQPKKNCKKKQKNKKKTDSYLSYPKGKIKKMYIYKSFLEYWPFLNLNRMFESINCVYNINCKIILTFCTHNGLWKKLCFCWLNLWNSFNDWRPELPATENKITKIKILIIGGNINCVEHLTSKCYYSEIIKLINP